MQEGKEPYISEKEPYISGNEPYISGKMPYISSKNIETEQWLALNIYALVF